MKILDFKSSGCAVQISYDPINIDPLWRLSMIERWEILYEEFIEKAKKLCEETNGDIGAKMVVTGNADKLELALFFTSPQDGEGDFNDILSRRFWNEAEIERSKSSSSL